MTTYSNKLGGDDPSIDDLLDALSRSAFRWQLTEVELRALINAPDRDKPFEHMGTGRVSLQRAQLTPETRSRIVLILEIDALLASTGSPNMVADWLRKPNTGLLLRSPIDVMASSLRQMRTVRDLLSAEAMQ